MAKCINIHCIVTNGHEIIFTSQSSIQPGPNKAGRLTSKLTDGVVIMNIRSNFNRNSIILIATSLFIALIGKVLIGNTTEGISLLIILTLMYVMIFSVAILCGPWAGFLTGAISLLIFTGGAIPVIYYESGPEPMYRSGYPEWFLYAFMGAIAGILAQKGFFKRWWSSLLAGYVTAVATTFLFIVLGQLFDRNTTGFVNISQPTDILNALLAAFLGVFNSSDTNFPATYLMFVALITFAIMKLPIPQWKRFIQGCPQPETTSTLSEAKPNRIIMIAGIILLLAAIMYFGFLLVFALGVSG